VLTARANTSLVGCRVISRPLGGTVDRLGGSLGRRRRCWRLEQEHKTGSLSVLAPSRVPEAVVTNLMQASRQNMLQEAAHELVAAQAGGPPLHRFTIFVADGDAFVVEIDNAVVGDGDTEHVAGEIAEHGLIAFAPGRTVHDPGLCPCSFRQGQVRPALFEGGPELTTYKNGQGLGRNQKAVARGIPMVAIVGTPPPVTRQWTWGR
jgi:hypothetical protein